MYSAILIIHRNGDYEQKSQYESILFDDMNENDLVNTVKMYTNIKVNINSVEELINAVKNTNSTNHVLCVMNEWKIIYYERI